MAAPITHIVLAFKLLPIMQDKIEKEFILGVSFPDIHHLDVISKKKVHFKNVTLDQIKKEKDSFKAGMLFHSYINEKYEDFYKAKIKKIIPKSRFSEYAFKFRVDIILTQYLDNQIASYFEDILKQQKYLKIDEEYLNAWHKALKNYIMLPKTRRNRFKFLKRCAKRKFGIVKDGWFAGAKKAVIYKVNKLLFDRMEKDFEEIENNDQIEKLVLDFYKTF